MFGFTRRPEVAAEHLPASSAVSRDPDLLLRRLEWTVLRKLDGVLQGDYRTLFRGAGFDLADLREYQPDDDVRHIDWNVTARLQVPHVREHQEDRELTGWMVIDLSGSVEFGSGDRSKRDLALQFTGVMARLLTRRGNRVGAVIYTGARNELIVPARSGRRHVLHMLARIGTVRPRETHRTGTDLKALFERTLSHVRRRCAVFVVSDFISNSDWSGALAGLARRHDVVAVRLFDPLEQALPDLGLISLRDAETGETLWVDSSDRAFRERFAQLAAAREHQLRESLELAGVDCLELATDDTLDDAMIRFITLRKRRAQLAGGGTIVTTRLDQ